MEGRGRTSHLNGAPLDIYLYIFSLFCPPSFLFSPFFPSFLFPLSFPLFSFLSSFLFSSFWPPLMTSGVWGPKAPRIRPCLNGPMLSFVTADDITYSEVVAYSLYIRLIRQEFAKNQILVERLSVFGIDPILS